MRLGTEYFKGRAARLWTCCATTVGLLLLCQTAGAAGQHGAATGDWGFFQQYCGDCHNATDWAGGIAFDVLGEESLATDAGVWEEAVKKLRGRLMPPPGKRPALMVRTCVPPESSSMPLTCA